MRCRHGLPGLVVLLFLAPFARAGMGSPLPTDFQRVLRLNESPLLRLQAISFFAVLLLGCAAAVRWLWNSLQRDVPKLPRLTYGRALAGVILWGLLFVIVLTMISGARELMTPGSWQRQGFIYKLSGEPSAASEASPAALRKQALERLRTALLHFAATHNGHFPSASETSVIASDCWEIPDGGGLRFLYLPGHTAKETAAPLVYEPELDPDHRLLLQTDGDIVTLRSADIRLLLERRSPP